jgi:UDP-N-acetylglucosamine 1-carboxyvinyltransferase
VRPEAPYELVKQMRASVMVLGPLLARYGKAKVSLPGGCQIGSRPVDQHLKGLEASARRSSSSAATSSASCPRLRGAEIVFDMPTVTGTENLMMAAALAKGRTTLVNCARRSPRSRSSAGSSTRWAPGSTGAGTDVIHIEGRDELAPFDHAIVSRPHRGRHVHGRGGRAGGDVLLENAPLEDLEAVVAKLRQDGRRDRARGLAPRASAATTARCARRRHDRAAPRLSDRHAGAVHGAHVPRAGHLDASSETIFENRFMHVPELAAWARDIDDRRHTGT